MPQVAQETAVALRKGAGRMNLRLLWNKEGYHCLPVINQLLGAPSRSQLCVQGVQSLR